jgi:glycosyltransferase involved in cell wall biosynthesis
LLSIGVLVLTYNEEENIKDCLESVNWVNEIVVIDSFSTDKTIEICQKYTDKVYRREFDDFSNQRNFGLEKIKSEWVLVVDSDERVSAQLKDEIKQKLTGLGFEGYRIPRKNYFLGKWIKHCGWYPDYTLRLFRNTTNFRGQVHEKVEIQGPIKNLDNPFVHFTYRDIRQFIKKADQYTTLDAYEMYSNGRKFKLIDILVNPMWRFIRMYFIKQGFRDGIQGFILSILYFVYAFLKYSKLWELSRCSDENSSCS